MFTGIQGLISNFWFVSLPLLIAWPCFLLPIFTMMRCAKLVSSHTIICGWWLKTKPHRLKSSSNFKTKSFPVFDTFPVKGKNASGPRINIDMKFPRCLKLKYPSKDVGLLQTILQSRKRNSKLHQYVTAQISHFLWCKCNTAKIKRKSNMRWQGQGNILWLKSKANIHVLY